MSSQLAITVLICLYVIPRLSIRKSDSMELMMLTKFGIQMHVSIWAETNSFLIQICRPNVASVCETEHSCFERLLRSGGESTSGVK